MRRSLPLAALAAALALPVTPAAAESTCPQIADDTERLACFDATYPNLPPSRVISGSTAPTGTPDSPDAPGNDEPVADLTAGFGAWLMDGQTSETTGTPDVFLWVDATEEIQCGGQTVRPSLFMRCMDNETAVLLVTDCEVTSEGVGGLVSYRVDDGPTRLRTFTERTDRTALGLWTYAAATPLLRDVKGGSEMVMRFSPAGESRQQELVFPIAGVDQAVAEVDKACGR